MASGGFLFLEYPPRKIIDLMEAMKYNGRNGILENLPKER